jgi:hypothetical protein
VGRKTIQRGPGKRYIEGKDFRLADEIRDEIRYIQNRAAEHDGRFVTVGSLALFSTDTGDAGCSIQKITWLRGWRGTAIPKMSTSKKPTSALLLAGKVNIESMATPSFTLTASRAASSPSSATPSGRIAEWG